MKNVLFLIAGLITCLTTPLLSQNETEIKVDGLLIPRVDRNVVSSPSLGQLIFDTTSDKFWFYDGSQWLEVDNDNQTLSQVLSEGNDAGNVKIANLADPTLSQDAATKNYVDQMSEMMLDAGLYGIVKDIDGNIYKTVKIGSQVWMAENLSTTHYNDGTPVPEITNDLDWRNLSSPGYCWYSNDSMGFATQYGALYNYFAVADTNTLNVCPTGWDVPSDDDWTILTDFLINNGYGYEGSGVDIGKSLASKFRWNENSGTIGVVGYDRGSNNSSGFTALPAGVRQINGAGFNFIGLYARWWSSTIGNNGAWVRFMEWDNENIDRDSRNKTFGYSVRCIRD